MLLHRLVKNWDLCVGTLKLPKGPSWHAWKRHFCNFKNGFTPDNHVTAFILLQGIHLNSDTAQHAAANSWLWICFKNIMLITSWFWEVVASTDCDFYSSVLLQLQESIAYPVVLQMYLWSWGKSAPMLLRRRFILV